MDFFLKIKNPKKFGSLKNLMYLWYIRLKLIGDERYSVFNRKKKSLKRFGSLKKLSYLWKTKG